MSILFYSSKNMILLKKVILVEFLHKSKNGVGNGVKTDVYAVCISYAAYGCFLTRYTKDKNIFGITWHDSIVSARKQSNAEYGIEMSDWIELGEDEIGGNENIVDIIFNRIVN